MRPLLINNAQVINEGRISQQNILIKEGKIAKIFPPDFRIPLTGQEIIDANGLYLLPGVIDDQVHFRDPGLTHKGDIYSESRAAVAGGVTSYMDMPNTIPHTTDIVLLEEKYEHASKNSFANYSFYMGATNDNIEELLKVDPKSVCGIKVFMGSSTGNMLVDKTESLERIFKQAPTLVATHCEDEDTIRRNIRKMKELFGDDLDMKNHPVIRSEEACYKSSSLAVKLAKRYGTRLHILHLSTAKELELFTNAIPLSEKQITAEVCVNHLWFDISDYDRLGTRIKWNPAIKTIQDKKALIKAVLDDTIDVIATDHAPHTLEEKNKTYYTSPSGGPLIQHSLVCMLDFFHKGIMSLEKIVEKMCHAPADLFKIEKRGYIREGYWADLVLVDLRSPWVVTKNNVLYKCKWSPFESTMFQSIVKKTFVNGNLVYDNGIIYDKNKGKRLSFDR